MPRPKKEANKDPTEDLLPKNSEVRKALAAMRRRANTERLRAEGRFGGPAKRRSVEEVIASGKPRLTLIQAKFVQGVVSGLNHSAAARYAGTNPGNSAKMAASPEVQGAIILARRKFEADAQMTRKKVIDMLLEAYQIAKIQSDPTAMIMGAREIGRMCGYYEAVKHKVEVSVSGQVTHQAIRNMTDEELLRLADQTREAIDAEFHKIAEEDEPQDPLGSSGDAFADSPAA